MTGAAVTSGTLAAMFAAFVLGACERPADREVEIARAVPPSTAASHGGLVSQGSFLYGRITTANGAVHEGRLRWGGDQEALWSNYFNGVKKGNPWVALTTHDLLPKERSSIRLFGKEIVGRNYLHIGRPFMARFGDIARIEPRGRDFQVILKSGTAFLINRNGADDMNDGVRVWDAKGGFVDIGERNIRTIEFLPAAAPNAAAPLYGTVRTRAGAFTGLIQWDRKACLGADELSGISTTGRRSLRFDTIRSIARRGESSVVTLLDGSEVLLSSTGATGRENSGIYVDDHRYGRVLISWDAFERVDFTPGGGPTYGDYQPGGPLMADVVTRSGRRIAGRLVFDLDESETTETLDAPSQGVDYTIPFSLISSIVPGASANRAALGATVTLLNGEVLPLERAGDLGQWNAGLLIFVDGRERPEHVPWAEVERVGFRPSPTGSR